jgi:iron complex transport system permease protein
MIKRQHYAKIQLLLLGVLCAIAWFSFFVGRYEINPRTVFDILWSRLFPVTPYWDGTLETVILQVRLPRILVGGALSISGAAYQTLFKNPMVSPDILGVSAGAGFGAALAMINSRSWWQIQSSALLFGLLAVVVAYSLGSVIGKQAVTILILAGIVVSSLFQAFISILKTLADNENVLPSITFWLMGSLGKVSNRDLILMLPAVALSLFLLFFFRSQINTLASGEDEAQTMGVNIRFIKGIVIFSSTLLTVSAVSICGIISWVGLIIPHIARILVGLIFHGSHLFRLLLVMHFYY